jgi:hypothetical protein
VPAHTRDLRRDARFKEGDAIDRIVMASTTLPPSALDQLGEEAIPALLETGESAMNLSIKTLTAVALAAAALAATTVPSDALSRGRPSGHGMKVPYHGTNLAGRLHGTGVTNCAFCKPTGPKQPPHRNPGWGHGHHWGHGYGHGGRGYGWRYRPYYVEPVALAAPAPVIAAPVAVAPVAAAPVAPAPGPVSCGGLTKQTMPDGSVLFADTCTKESAIAPPAEVATK